MIVTVNEALIASGTHLLMTRPRWTHLPCGCGDQRRASADNVYMSFFVRTRQVSLLSSFSWIALSIVTGGSKRGQDETESKTENNIVVDSILSRTILPAQVLNYIFRTHFDQHIYPMETKKVDRNIRYFEKLEFSVRARGVMA